MCIAGSLVEPVIGQNFYVHMMGPSIDSWGPCRVQAAAWKTIATRPSFPPKIGGFYVVPTRSQALHTEDNFKQPLILFFSQATFFLSIFVWWIYDKLSFFGHLGPYNKMFTQIQKFAPKVELWAQNWMISQSTLFLLIKLLNSKHWCGLRPLPGICPALNLVKYNYLMVKQHIYATDLAWTAIQAPSAPAPDPNGISYRQGCTG